MISIGTLPGAKQFVRGMILIAVAMTLAGCAMSDVDDTTGSHLTQAAPVPGEPPRKPVDADDIAIVGQEAAHSIMDLPVIASAANPPLVQFTGVTSIISGPVPVDTDPYTELLRDRLLLITREKLRFIERTLPPLVTSSPKKSKKKKDAPTATPEVSTDPDYNLLAEMRGRYEDDLYKIQVQFVDAHTGEILFDGLYRIRKEASEQPAGIDASMAPEPPPAPALDATTAQPPPSPTGIPPAQ
jgi:hypothetical protein